MKTIRLYGDMGKRFGREFELDVATPAEAVRALCSQLEGFRSYMHEHAQSAYKVFVGGRNASDGIDNPCSDKEIIRIAPVTQGAGALGRVVLGAALIISTFIPGSPTFGNNIVLSMGASMVLGGVIEMLSPVQSVSSGLAGANNTGNTPSYNFDGPTNTVAQGHPVPLAYGKLIVGSAVISAGITT